MAIGPQLSALEGMDLIQLEAALPDLAYVFRHVLVRDVVYATLVRRQRRNLHQAAGDVLESLHPEQAEALPLAPQLGAHFAEAGDKVRALKYLTLAGDQAARQYANHEAAQYYARALEIARSQSGAPLAHLYEARGQALELCGDYAGALDSYKDMEAQARERQDEALELEALTAQAHIRNVFTTVSDPVLGQAVLERALQLAQRLGDGAAEARLLLYMMRRFVWTSETDQVIAYGEQAAGASRSLGLTPVLIEGLNELARWGYLNRARLGLTLQRLEEARELLRGVDDPNLRLENLIGLGTVLTIMGDFERVRRLLPELHQISQAMDYGWGLARYHGLSGNLYLEQGDLGAAISGFEVGIRDMRSEGGRLLQCEALVYQGRALLGTGNLERARDVLLEARAVAEASGMGLNLWRALAVLAEVEARRGDPAEGQRLRQELRPMINELAERTGSPERRASFMGTREVRAALEPA